MFYTIRLDGIFLWRSHRIERIFDRLQNLSGHFVQSGSFNIFALFTLYFERLVRLKFCTIEVIPCKQKSLHTRIFNRPKIRPVPCERRQRSFWATHVNRKWSFCNLRRDFDQIFRKIVSMREKTFRNTNLVETRHIKREKCFRLTCVRSLKNVFV